MLGINRDGTENKTFIGQHHLEYCKQFWGGEATKMIKRSVHFAYKERLKSFFHYKVFGRIAGGMSKSHTMILSH